MSPDLGPYVASHQPLDSGRFFKIFCLGINVCVHFSADLIQWGAVLMQIWKIKHMSRLGVACWPYTFCRRNRRCLATAPPLMRGNFWVLMLKVFDAIKLRRRRNNSLRFVPFASTGSKSTSCTRNIAGTKRDKDEELHTQEKRTDIYLFICFVIYLSHHEVMQVREFEGANIYI